MSMQSLARRTLDTLRPLRVSAALIALAVVPVVAGVARLVDLLNGQASAGSERFFDQPLPVTIHILAVIPYSLMGALQFAPTLRRRGWHRAVGIPLIPLGLAAALTGLWMAQFYPWPQGDGEAVYLMRVLVGMTMTYSLVRGAASLWSHDYIVHGAWMLRGYALGMGAGTQVLTHLPWFVLVGGTPDEGSRALMMGLAWVINASVAEYSIRTRSVRPGHGRQARPQPALGSAT